MRARDIGVCVKIIFDEKSKITEYNSKKMYLVDLYFEGSGRWNYATCSDDKDDLYLVFFTMNQIREHLDLVNWKYFTRYNVLTNSIIDKLYDFIEWSEIIDNESVDEKMIEHYRDNIKLIKTRPHIKYSEEFLYRNAEYLDWMNICYNIELSETFMIDFADKLYWSIVSDRQNLSENLIKKYSDRLDWKAISRKQFLSKELIEKNMHRLNLSEMKYNNKIIQAYGKEYVDNLYVKMNTISELEYSSQDINSLIRKTLLIDECLLAEHIDKIDWSHACYIKLSESFMIKYEKKIDWSKMGKNKGLTEKLLKKHWGELNKNDLVNNTFLNNKAKELVNYYITNAYKEICDENIGIVDFITNHPIKRNFYGNYEPIKPDFGFIKNRYHEKIFFNVKHGNYKLEVGDYVKFKIVQGNKGLKAIHIMKLKEIPI